MILKEIKKYWHYLFIVFFFTSILHPHGFIAGTLVHTQRGLVPIENCIVGDYVFGKQKLTAYPIFQTSSYSAKSFIKITVDDESIHASINQKLYVVSKDGWISAGALEPSDQLLCRNGETVAIKEIEVIEATQKMHALSIETDHTFGVGKHAIIAHNIEPTTTAAATVALSLACPPAGAAIVIGEIIALCGVGIGMYCMHKKIEKQRKEKKGCFSEKNPINSLPDCRMPKAPVEELAVCKIPISNANEINEIIPYQKSQERDVGCAFPIEVPKDTHSHKYDNGEEKEHYNGPWYNRTEDWINDHPFGQKIKKSLERSQYTNQGKRAFRVVQKIENCDGFKKGDYVAVDAMHRDHLEVFDKRGRWIQVANFDGTKNNEKTKQGEKEFRGSLE